MRRAARPSGIKVAAASRWLRRHRAALCALAAIGIAFAGWAALDARFAAKEARYDRAMASIAYEGGRLALRVYYRCEDGPWRIRDNRYCLQQARAAARRYGFLTALSMEPVLAFAGSAVNGDPDG